MICDERSKLSGELYNSGSEIFWGRYKIPAVRCPGSSSKPVQGLFKMPERCFYTTGPPKSDVTLTVSFSKRWHLNICLNELIKPCLERAVTQAFWNGVTRVSPLS